MAAKQGKAYPQYLLAYMYDQGKGVAQDQAQAAQWFRKAAEQNNADAQESLASMLFFGRGVQQDYTEAAKWYGKVAEQGRVYPQYLMGWMCERAIHLAPQDRQ